MEKNVNSTIKLAIFARTVLYNTSALSAEYIKKITIQSNKINEKSTIENYLKLQVGEEYNTSKGDKAIKNLYSTSLFDNISITLVNGGNLIVTVSETPFITIVVFTGNPKIKKSSLSKELLAMSGESMSPAKIQLDVEKFKEIYKRSGRFSTTVTPKIERLENDRVKVTFDIAEGPKSTVKNLFQWK